MARWGSGENYQRFHVVFKDHCVWVSWPAPQNAPALAPPHLYPLQLSRPSCPAGACHRGRQSSRWRVGWSLCARVPCYLTTPRACYANGYSSTAGVPKRCFGLVTLSCICWLARCGPTARWPSTASSPGTRKTPTSSWPPASGNTTGAERPCPHNGLTSSTASWICSKRYYPRRSRVERKEINKNLNPGFTEGAVMQVGYTDTYPRRGQTSLAVLFYNATLWPLVAEP